MIHPLKGQTLTAECRLPDGRQVLTIVLDRDGIGNLLDDPDSLALLQIPDLLGHGPLTVVLLEGECGDPQLEQRLRQILAGLTAGRVTAPVHCAAWEQERSDAKGSREPEAGP